MATHSTLPLVDALAEEVSRRDSWDHVARARAAFVRSLVDEVSHRHPSDPRVAVLHEQIGEELTRLAEAAQGGRAVAPSPEGPLYVLVVDDDDDSRAAMVSVLRVLGHPCRAVANAEEALAEYEREPAAIVVSDWTMPGMSGLELCQALKRRCPYAYVILATAYRENAKLLDGAIAGADDFLHKPLEMDELALRLRAAERLVRAVRVISRLIEGATA